MHFCIVYEKQSILNKLVVLLNHIQQPQVQVSGVWFGAFGGGRRPDFGADLAVLWKGRCVFGAL